MKEQMLDMMLLMMPYMMWVVYAGAAFLAIGLLMGIIRLISGSGGGLARLAAGGALAVGLFFLAAQVAGMWLGTPPSMNFGDPTQFEFKLYPFWQLGLVALVGGIIVRMLAGSSAKY